MDLTEYMTENKKQHYRSTLRCRLLSVMSQLNSITQLPPPVSSAPNITLNSANGCFWQMHPDSYAFMHLSLKQAFSNAVFFACFHLSPSCESATSVTSRYIRRKWIWFQPPEPEPLHIAHLSPETLSNHPSACLCLSVTADNIQRNTVSLTTLQHGAWICSRTFVDPEQLQNKNEQTKKKIQQPWW